MSSTVEVPDADLARIVAFLDGALPENEARAFELRLGRESALARAFEELAAVDDELRRTLSVSRRPAKLRAPVLALALAAGIALLLGALWWLRGAERPLAGSDFEIALIETAPSDADFNELLGFDSEWLPRGMGYRSGTTGDAHSAPPADEYARELNAVLRQRVQVALTSESELERADSFLLAFRPKRECYVALIVEREGRAGELLMPLQVPSEPLRPDRTYLLPGEPLVLPADWSTSQRVEFKPGILTRAGVHVTLAVRNAPLSAELLRELTQLLAGGPDAAEGAPLELASGGLASGELTEWLMDRGFVTNRLRVGAY